MELLAGKTLLVDGPAVIRVIGGKASIFECELTPRKQYFLRPWKRYPVYAETNTSIELSLGQDSATTLVDNDEFRDVWVEKINEWHENQAVGVLGGIDTGKTSFTTLAVNTLVKKFGKCIVVSLDPGQTYFTPPTVIGAAEAKQPIHDLAELKPFWQTPVGSTSAANTAPTVIEAVSQLSRSISGKATTVVDLDGWVEGPAAAVHKTAVLKTLGCGKAVLLGTDLQNLRESLTAAGISVTVLSTSKHVKTRDAVERKRIREWCFRKFLGKTSLRHFPISWLNIGIVGHDGEDPLEFFRQAVKSAVNVSPPSSNETFNIYNVLCKHGMGLIAYLYDVGNNYIGLGIFCGYNADRGVVKLITSVTQTIHKVMLGKVVLSAEGDEKLLLD